MVETWGILTPPPAPLLHTTLHTVTLHIIPYSYRIGGFLCIKQKIIFSDVDVYMKYLSTVIFLVDSIYCLLQIMLLQATIIRNYFVKTQTSVASFGPPDLSIIFSNGMYLEVSPL